MKATVGWVRSSIPGILPYMHFCCSKNDLFVVTFYTYVHRSWWISTVVHATCIVSPPLLTPLPSVFLCFAASPFYLAKTRLQARAAATVAVGFQHKQVNLTSVLKDVYTKGGFLGLWAGVNAGNEMSLSYALSVCLSAYLLTLFSMDENHVSISSSVCVNT